MSSSALGHSTSIDCNTYKIARQTTHYIPVQHKRTSERVQGRKHEALAPSRRESSEIKTKAQTTPNSDLAQTLEIIQGLQLKLIAEGQTAFRIESVSLELLQETLVEARTGRMMLWEILAVPALRDRGKIAYQKN